MTRWLPKHVLPGMMAGVMAGLMAIPLLSGPSYGQQTPEQLAARCAQLGAIYDRYNTRRSEGSGGPDLTRVGAGIDCQKGRYDQGIKTLEGLLQRSKTPYPPAN